MVRHQQRFAGRGMRLVATEAAVPVSQGKVRVGDLASLLFMTFPTELIPRAGE